MTLKKIAIVGRPNVGKSALFNRLADRRIAIVDEEEGITRDRLYAETDFFGHRFCLIDTGGIDGASNRPFNDLVIEQSKKAIVEADAAILVVDGRMGATQLDQEVAKILQQQKKPVIVAVNKIDELSDDLLIHQFHSLSFARLIGVSALHGTKIAELMETVIALFPATPDAVTAVEEKNTIRVAIVGRSNVGKSTLLNFLLGDQRSIVSPIAGTTRDAIDAPFSLDGQDYLLIDTAGIRRKKTEKETVDRCASLRTDEAIERSDVVLLILDATAPLTTQEKRIARDIENQGKSCIILFNKWDLVHGVRMEHLLRAMREDAAFLAHCPSLCICALKGRNAQKIFPLVKQVFADRLRRITTGELNHFVERCVQKYHPPMLTGKRLRIYYMTQVEVAPPRFVLFVNKPQLMVDTYLQYLSNQFREKYRFAGCPIVFEMRGKQEYRPEASS